MQALTISSYGLKPTPKEPQFGSREMPMTNEQVLAEVLNDLGKPESSHHKITFSQRIRSGLQNSYDYFKRGLVPDLAFGAATFAISFIRPLRSWRSLAVPFTLISLLARSIFGFVTGVSNPTQE